MKIADRHEVDARTINLIAGFLHDFGVTCCVKLCDNLWQGLQQWARFVFSEMLNTFHRVKVINKWALLDARAIIFITSVPYASCCSPLI